MKVFLAASCGMVLLITGCSPHKVSQDNKLSFTKQESACDNSDHDDNISVIKELEAKLIDIPIPLDVEPIPYYFENGSKRDDATSLGYESRSSLNDLTLFYTQEMERLGWKKRVTVDAVETLLYFEKPGKYCAVSLRPNVEKPKKQIGIIIFMGQR